MIYSKLVGGIDERNNRRIKKYYNRVCKGHNKFFRSLKRKLYLNLDKIDYAEI